MRPGIVAALLCMLVGACEKADQNKLKDAAKEVGRQATDAAIDLADHLMPVPEDPPANEGKLLIKEVSLSPLPKDVSLQDIDISPDQRHVAFVVKRRGKSVVLVDGKEGKAYDDIRKRQGFFSPDSRRVAYAASRGGQVFIVVDGVESEGYEAWEWTYAIFSPDSKRLAFPARRDGKAFIVIDGAEGKPYRDLRTQPPWPRFSPDSKRFAYLAQRTSGTWVTVIDGVEGPVSDRFFGDVSHDAKRMAYAKTLGPELRGMLTERSFVAFSPNSEHVAFVAEVVTKSLGPLRMKKNFVVLDGKAGPTYSYVKRPIFSPDSKSLAYSANKGKTWTVVRDGKEGPEHRIGEAWRTKIVFSPDSKRMGYWASQARKVEFVVVDGVSSPRYSIVDPDSPVFSPDSKHVAYWAYPNYKYGWRIFVDGSYSDKYGEPLYGSKLTFDGPDSLHALAVKDGEILRVEIKIQP